MRDKKHPHLHVLTGPVLGGKTSLLREKTALLKEGGFRVMGILCPGKISEGRRSEFWLENIHTGEQIPMGSERVMEGWKKYRRFYFNPQAFLTGEVWIQNAVSEQADLLVLDEVGPMELEGQGWYGILEKLQNNSGIKQLWTVREKLVPEVCRRWNIPDDQVYTGKSMEALLKKWQL